MEEKNTVKNHKHGHRERLRRRYLENGIDALAEHEILEFILFYGIPRVDTKPIAYRLIDEFGSLKAVLSAPYEALVSAGLTSACASYIKLFDAVPLWVERNGIVGKKLTGYSELGNFFHKELCNEKTEKVLMLMLDSKNRVIGLRKVADGSFSEVSANTRFIADECIKHKAAKVVLAHNHPGGSAELSVKDHMANSTLDNLFNMLGVTLIEHYIITENAFFGINKYREDDKTSGDAVYLANHGYHTEL
ncbi:MAG: hypothetical protein E7600_04990 [Ruminococcaceae bacterium]|nr:hypothetical protein [Oscillospiraceae bacterium]